MGNHMAVTVGGLQGHLELNVFKPLIAYNVLQSIRLLSDAAMSFADRTVAGLEPDRERIAALLEQSLLLVTALAPELGYDNAASIAKDAHATGKTLLDEGLEPGVVDGGKSGRETCRERMWQDGVSTGSAVVVQKTNKIK